MLKINGKSMRNIDDKTTNLQQAFHPTLGSYRCCYKLVIHPIALAYFWVGGEYHM